MQWSSRFQGPSFPPSSKSVLNNLRGLGGEGAEGLTLTWEALAELSPILPHPGRARSSEPLRLTPGVAAPSSARNPQGRQPLGKPGKRRGHRSPGCPVGLEPAGGAAARAGGDATAPARDRDRPGRQGRSRAERRAACGAGQGGQIRPRTGQGRGGSGGRTLALSPQSPGTPKGRDRHKDARRAGGAEARPLPGRSRR